MSAISEFTHRDVAGESRQIAEILDRFGDGFVVLDFEYRVVYINSAAEAHYSLDRRTTIGRIAWDQLALGANSQMRQFVERAMAGRVEVEVEAPSEVRPGRWFNLKAFPLAVGLGISFRDITERRTRMAREAEYAERLELALATSGFGDWRWDMATDMVDLSPRAAEMAGVPPGPVMTWTDMLAQVHPDDRAPAIAAVTHAMQTGEPYEIEYRITRPDNGEERWIKVRASVQTDDDGRPTGLLGVLTDITESKAAEARIRADRARLAELERRRAYLLEISDALRVIDDPEQILTTASRMMAERLNVGRMGYAEVPDEGDEVYVRGDWTIPGLPSLAGRSFVLGTFGPTLMSYLRRGLDLAVDDVRYDPRSAANYAAYKAIQVRGLIVVPLVRNGRLDALFYAHDPKPRRWSREDVALMEEVASRTWAALARARVERQAGERQRLLINELNHRVKNTLATIQSLVHQTLRDGIVTRDARERLTERLLALSAAHNVLTRENWQSADLGEIAREALRPYDDPPGARIDLSGPTARLPPNVALALSMALHELATNAVKYGALSAAEGRVRVGWTMAEGGKALVLDWEEAGGPCVAPPTATGFGTRLLAGLTGELRAPADLVYAPKGVTCRLQVPIS
ncbi:PAS domain-containing sensor histidine kinase [Phenylobacterium sp.]|uniref:PAS domain-containing sensor histidine kinase n=1 Tax=Phenylobacterium sp. TaxID=1871053 RepID=UPI002ED7E588